MCSNAFIQAIAVALFAGSVAAGFSICICPKDGFPELATALLQLDLSGFYHPVSINWASVSESVFSFLNTLNKSLRFSPFLEAYESI